MSCASEAVLFLPRLQAQRVCTPSAAAAPPALPRRRCCHGEARSHCLLPSAYPPLHSIEPHSCAFASRNMAATLNWIVKDVESMIPSWNFSSSVKAVPSIGQAAPPSPLQLPKQQAAVLLFTRHVGCPFCEKGVLGGIGDSVPVRRRADPARPAPHQRSSSWSPSQGSQRTPRSSSSSSHTLSRRTSSRSSLPKSWRRARGPTSRCMVTQSAACMPHTALASSVSRASSIRTS